MSRLLFAPFSILGGVLAGILGRKAFEGLWSTFDDRKAPEPKYREAEWQKLIPALLLQGAIFRAARGIVDHASRRAFRKLTGSWPGKDRPASS